MPRINSIDFYQNRPKIKIFLPKKYKFFERWGIRPYTLCLRWLGALPPTPIVYGVWEIRPQIPATSPRPHCRFLVTGMLEEKFTARYCRHPFILAFGFKYAWNVWRRRWSYLQTVYNAAKSISPGNTYTEKLSQKSFHLHQPHFGFGRDEVFLFLNIVRSSNKFYRAKQPNLIFAQNCRVKNTVLSFEIFGCHLPWNPTN